MRTKSLTNSKQGRKTIKTVTEKTVNTNEMLGKETKVLQRTITMNEVIFEELEADASQEDKGES